MADAENVNIFNWIPLDQQKPILPENDIKVKCLIYDTLNGISTAYFKKLPKSAKSEIHAEGFTSSSIGVGYVFSQVTHWIYFSDIPLPKNV